jgi:DNA-binding winged helix-turn-helix (wHTH) protein
LQEEVDFFWQRRATDPAWQPPFESRLRGYVANGSDDSAIPQGLRALPPGMHLVQRQIVMVDVRGDTRLVLSYPRSEANLRSAKMVAAPVLLALLALAASAWFTYRNAKRIVAPLEWIARAVREWDPMDPDPTVLGPDRLPPDAGPEARLRALIRRERRQVGSEVLKVADLVLDPASLRATRGGVELQLSPIGLKLLTILMRESPRVVSRQEIEREIWGNGLPDSDTLRSHLYNLRKTIDKPYDKPLLHTVQSAGYRIADIEQPPA